MSLVQMKTCLMTGLERNSQSFFFLCIIIPNEARIFHYLKPY